MMYHSLVGYRGGDHKNYQEAKKYGAIHETPSDMDCLYFCGGSTNGLFDALEMITLFENISGIDDMVFGIVHEDAFYVLQYMAGNVEKYSKTMDFRDLIYGAEEK